MHYWVLLVTALVCGIGCWASYNEEAKQAWWYMPLGFLLGLIGSGSWFYVCKLLSDKEKIFVFNLMWDAVMVAVYYGLPLLLFGVKLDRMSFIGATLILVGIFILKARC